MSLIGKVQSIENGKFFVKTSQGEQIELKVQDEIKINDLIIADASNSTSSKIEILFEDGSIVVLNQGELLVDISLFDSTLTDEETAFKSEAVNETLAAWSGENGEDIENFETAAGDVTEQETAAGDEAAQDGGALRSRFSARDGDSTNIVSDLREASFGGGIQNNITEIPNKLIQTVYAIIEGVEVIKEGDEAQYVVKLVDIAGNPVIAAFDTTIYVTYTNKSTQNGDTEFNNNHIIEVVIKAGTSQTTFTVKTNDDFISDDGEVYNLAITGSNSIDYDVRSGDSSGNKSNVDTTIIDNSNKDNPNGETGGVTADDTVYAIITGATTVAEGDEVTYTVKLVDKDGNEVTPTKDTVVTVKYTDVTTQNGEDTNRTNNENITVTIQAGTNQATFTVATKDDYLADNNEQYKVEITNVDDKGQFEKVQIGSADGLNKDVTTTINDNTDTQNPNGETGGVTADDTVYAIITGATTVAEGDEVTYTVKLVDKNGNEVTPTKDTVVTVKYTDETTQNGEDTTRTNNENITVTIQAGTNQATFTVATKDDYLADNNEQYRVEITNVDDKGQFEKVQIGSVDGLNKDVTTTIKDNTTTNPNENSNVEKTQENVIIKIVAADINGNPIKDTNGNYILANEVAEGDSANYVVLAFTPNTTTFNDSSKLAIQGGTVEVSTQNKSATADDYETKTKVTVELGKVITVATKDDFIADNNETFEIKIEDSSYKHPTTPLYENVLIDKSVVTTTIKDNTTTNPNENSNVEKTQENVIIKIVAADENGNPIKDTNGNYVLANEVVEGNSANYVVLAFNPNTTTFNDSSKLEIQGGTVTIKTANISATGVASQSKFDGTQDYQSKEAVVTLGQKIDVNTFKDYKTDNNETFSVSIVDKSYNHPTTPLYENVSIDKSVVTTTIVDSDIKTEENTVFARITGNWTKHEGSAFQHTVSLIDKNGNPVQVPVGETVTVTLEYKLISGTDDGKDDYVTKTEVVQLIQHTSNGGWQVKVDSLTKIDFINEGKEVYEIKIVKVEQENNSFEKLIPHPELSRVTETILDGISFDDAENSRVDEDNFYTNNSSGTNTTVKTTLSTTKSLGFTIPRDYVYGDKTFKFEDEVGTVSAKFANINELPNLTSDGVAITYSLNADGTKLEAKAGAVKVFDVVLNKAGTYTYTQYENLDHSNSGNANTDYETVNTNDNIALNFKFIVEINKNGTVVATSEPREFTVTVNDSTPDSQNRTETLNEDGTLTIVISDEHFKNGEIELDNGNGFVNVAKGGTIDILDGGVKVGTLTNNANGTLTFKPEANYSNYGSDNLPNFKYKVSDTDGDYAEATISLKVNPVVDGAIIHENRTITVYEDDSNTKEGTYKVSLGLDFNNIEILDSVDKNNNAKGDTPEKADYINLTFAGVVAGTKLLAGTNEIDLATSNTVKVVIVDNNGEVDKTFHHSGIKTTGTGVIALTKDEYNNIKIQLAEDNDKDIKVNISTKVYEVNDNGEILTSFDSKTANASINVIVKAVTDDIKLEWNNTGGNLGVISADNKTFTYKELTESKDNIIYLKALLTKTSGTEDFAGAKADLDGSEARTYVIKDIPEGTVVTLGTQSATAGKDGTVTIVFSAYNNTQADPDFSMRLPEDYAGEIKATITLQVRDNGSDGNGDINDYGYGANGIKKAEVKLNINVTPQADEATLKVGQGLGFEDQGRSNKLSDVIDEPENAINLAIKTSSTDQDGSETQTISIDSIPTGGYIYYNGGLYNETGFVNGTPTAGITVEATEPIREEIKDEDGNVTGTKETPAWKITIPEYDNSNPKFVPPLNVSGFYKFKVSAWTVDKVTIDGADVIDTQKIAVTKDLNLYVFGVADAPINVDLKEVELESGKVITTILKENTLDDNGNKFALKDVYKNSSSADFKISSYDTDGSEDLSVVIKGLPAGFSVENALPMGNGSFAFKAEDLDNIKIVTPVNYSGELNFTLTYVTTEGKGGIYTSAPDMVKIFIDPEIDSIINKSSTGNEDEPFGVNFGILSNNGDTDEKLAGIKILKADVENNPNFKLFVSGVEISQANLTVDENGYYVLTLDQAKHVTAQASENLSGSFDFGFKYLIQEGTRDANGKLVEIEKAETFTLHVNAVTDTPEIKFGDIVVDDASKVKVDGTTIKVHSTGGEFKLPLGATSDDTDGSEKITKIVITGVPVGATIESALKESDELKITSSHNGVYTIEGANLEAVLNKTSQDIVFKVNGNADYLERDIKISVYTKDSGEAKEEVASKVITLEKFFTDGTGGNSYANANIEFKDPAYVATEDTSFNLLKLFNMNSFEGLGKLNFTLKLANGYIDGLTPDENGVYNFGLKGNKADMEAKLSNFFITPNENLNSNEANLEVTLQVAGKEQASQEITVKPVTDDLTIAINSVDSIKESGNLEFGISLNNSADNSNNVIVDNKLYIKLTENFESGETTTGVLKYNGVELLPNSNGEYEIEVPANYQLGDTITGFEYISAYQRHGNVEISARVAHKESTNIQGYETQTLTSTSSKTVTVEAVVDAKAGNNLNINSDSTEDRSIKVGLVSQLATITSFAKEKHYLEDLSNLISDNSEKLVNVVIRDIPKDATVYYKISATEYKMAINTGGNDETSSWVIPVKDNQMPYGVEIKTPLDFSGTFDYKIEFYVQEFTDGKAIGEAVAIVKDMTANVTPVADGVKIEPELSGIQKTGDYAKAFEWTDLNLNASMEDTDGSETLTLKFTGLNNSAQFRVYNNGEAKDLEATFNSENGEWQINGIEAKDINNIQLLHDKAVNGVKVVANTVDIADIMQNGELVKDVSVSKEVEANFDLRVSDISSNKFSLGQDVSIDFDKNGISFEKISEINLQGNGVNKLLNIELDDVIKMFDTGNDNIIKITRDKEDEVTFKDTIKDGEVVNKWEKADSTVTDSNGKEFDVYTTTSDDKTLTIHVEHFSDGVTN